MSDTPYPDVRLGLGRRGWYVAWLLLAAVVFVADQISKQWVTDALNYGEQVRVLPVFAWTLVHNTGAAFSFLHDAGGWQRWFLAGVGLLFSAWLAYDLRRMPPAALLGFAYAFILGGAAGNLLDRIADGYVVDFALAHWGTWTFPAFNLADASVTVGAALWIWVLLTGADPDNGPSAPAPVNMDSDLSSHVDKQAGTPAGAKINKVAPR